MEHTKLFAHKKRHIVNIERNDLAIVNSADVNSVVAKHTANKSILFINLDALFAELQTLDFVDRVYIKRYFPNTLKIVIFERDIHFTIKPTDNTTNKEMYIVDSNFNIEKIDQKNKTPQFLYTKPFIKLDCQLSPSVKTSIIQMQKTLLNFKNIYSDITSLHFVNCHSWVVNLQNGNVILLEEGAEARSLYKYNTNLTQINSLGVGNRVDLRFEGKIYIKPVDGNTPTQNSIQKINTANNE